MLSGYYQRSKERLQKRLMKGIKIFLINRKAKSISMLMIYIKIFLKKTSYEQLNQVSINLFDMGATYQPELVGT